MQMGKRRHLRDHQKTSSEIAAGTNNDEITVKERVSKSSEQNNKDDDEVVKYMSKLPGYLQGGEESSNVLNVGVLDWARLEKWKHHGRAQRSSGCKPDTKVSSTSPTLGTVPNASSSSSPTSHQYHHRCKIDDQVHASSLLGKLNKASRGLQHSSHGVRCKTLESEFASRDSLSKQDIAATCSYNKSSGKGRRSTSDLLPEMGNSVGSLGAKGNLLVVRDKKESEKRAGEIHAQVARGRVSERWKQCAEKFDGEEKTVGDSNACLTSVKEEDHHVSNIVLLRSRKHPRSTLSGDPHMSSLDDNVKVTREFSSHSLHFPDRISSSLGLRSQVPRSCPLSFDLERDSEDMRLPPCVDLSCKQERSGGTTRHSKTASRRILDQEKKRDPSSPSKRFSFSFGRLSRSFTSKEADSSAGGQPLTSSDGPSHQSSNPEKEKHCGSRASPLRRLLDHPLLKSKASENVLPSSKEERSTSSSSNQKPTNMDENKQQQDTRRTRALFQLTTRNGIPLFQFVVNDDNLDNSRSILGATMKSSASSFKDESVQYCTFYSVNEVKKKKKGSWLMHGHREKQQHRFVYNVIGEMRLCNSSMSSDITEKISEKVSSVIRESVLVDETEQMKGRKEIAAVVIKKKDAEETLEETTVIIPGGVHSFPEKGEPTPLVTRWKSGGLCDCGGWDIGCKLHILSNKTVLHELDQSFKLFAQEESDRDSGGPVLAMTELKTGMYRVEFGSFLSHLQAFFVCVTVITCASEEKTVSKTSGRSSSPFAPPLSPVSRV
ncbi:Enolase [Hirschfeldia incana]|nr:Enolase [Hirschfeldia incana]KAJ0235059.1 Enolase [Hirschfeldia incana]